jgi:O-antigen ligase
MYLVYYFLYVNSKNINNKDDLFKILNVMLIIGIINTLFAVLQVYLPYNNIINKFYHYIGYGLIGHHNFLGTFSLLLLSLSLYISLFISDKKFYKFTTIIMFICLLLTNSSGPFLSFGLIFLILLIYIIIKKHDLIKKILIYSLIFIALFFTVEISSSYVNKIYKPNVIVTNLQSDMINILRIFGINIGDIKQPDIVIKMPKNGELDLIGGMNTVSSGRLDVYKSVIKYIDYGNYLWLGTGPDNMQVYRVYFIRKSNNQATFIIYDKAHNIYLNVIAETGIFSFIFYIAWIVSYHLKTKKCKNELMYLLLFGLISYNIQGLFNIDVYMVMPYYLIIAGMLMGIGDKLETRKH